MSPTGWSMRKLSVALCICSLPYEERLPTSRASPLWLWRPQRLPRPGRKRLRCRRRCSFNTTTREKVWRNLPMRSDKRRHLETKGWRVGTVREFLHLSQKQATVVERYIAERKVRHPKFANNFESGYAMFELGA